MNTFVSLAFFTFKAPGGSQSGGRDVLGYRYMRYRSTHTANQLKHVRVVVVGGIEYRSIDPPPQKIYESNPAHTEIES